MSGNYTSDISRLLELAKNPSIEVLNSFGNNYSTCENSGFFPAQTLLDVKHSATSFLFLGLDTTSVARLTSSNWISKVTHFYDNIGKMQSREATKSMFDQLGGEAKRLGKIFRVIAGWARYLGGQLHQARIHVLTASQHFTNNFSGQLVAAQRELSEVKGGLILAMATGQDANAKVNEAMRNLEAARQCCDRGRVIANEAATVANTLAYMESVAEEIAFFWSKQNENWMTQGFQKMLDEAFSPVQVLEATIAPKDITCWNQLKQLFDKFVEVMTKVTGMCNYPSEAALPGPTTTLRISELNYFMAIPSALNADYIMAD